MAGKRGDVCQTGIALTASRWIVTKPEQRVLETRQRRELAQLGLPDFERAADCHARQQDMIRRLGNEEFPTSCLDRCNIECCAEDTCREGCHFGSRRRRYETIPTAAKVLRGKGPFYRLTLVHPSWRAPVGQLSHLNHNAMRQWSYRVISRFDGVIAVGIIEVSSLNVELDGSLHWPGEVQLVVAGIKEEDLKAAFQNAIPKRLREPNGKPVMVNDVVSLGRSLGYAQKRFVERRVAYLDPRTGRQARNHLPLLPEEALEHDRWLLSLPLGALTIAIGCRRRGQKIFPL